MEAVGGMEARLMVSQMSSWSDQIGDVEKYSPEEDLRSVRRTVDPRLPSVKDVKDHELQGHLPFRHWCSVCVRAKGKELDHRSDLFKERSVPECSFDFAFPGDEFGHKTAVLVGKEKMSGLVLEAAILVKGSEGWYMLDKVLDYFARRETWKGGSSSSRTKSLR